MTSVSPESSSLKSAPSLLAFLAGRPGRRPVGTLAAFLATGPAAAVLVAALAAVFAAVDVVAAFLATALDATVLVAAAVGAAAFLAAAVLAGAFLAAVLAAGAFSELGRASCRERMCQYV